MFSRQYNLFMFMTLIIMLLLIFLSINMGRFALSPEQIIGVFSQLMGKTVNDLPDNAVNILLQVRLPRILSAIVIGMSLSTAGAVYQGFFKNPMVSPDILGVSAGACFGAALAILFQLDRVFIQLSAFAFGIASVCITYVVSMAAARKNNNILVLVLSGIIVESIFSALLACVKFVADTDNALPEITFWLLGSMASATLSDLVLLLIMFVIGYIPLYFLRWRLNVVSCGEEAAESMGINVKVMSIVVIAASTLLSAASVSVAGKVSWVGLIVPHLARMLVGSNFKRLIPATAMIGGIFLLFVDNICRTLITSEIPLGIVVSLCGAPFFLYLMVKNHIR